MMPPCLAARRLPRSRNYRLGWFIGFLAAGCALFVPLAHAQDNAALIERARLANDSRQFEQARADLAVVLARSPWNESALLEQARLLYFEHNHEDAWKTVNALLGEYPRNATALNLRGLLNLEWKKDNEAALADFTSAVQHDPKLAKAFINRGRALRALKRPAEALEDADAAIELEPENASFRWIRGLIFLELKQPLRGLENFNDAIDLRPDDAEMRVRRATLHHSLWTPNTQAETFGAMKPDVERALELVPGHPEALLLRGYCLEFEQDPAAAFDSYFAAYQKLPDDTRVWQALQKTCRTQFEPGRDPARVYQLLADVKERFVRSNYDPDQGRHLEAVFDFIPFKVASTDPERLRNKDYLERLLRSNPGNLRLLYHVHVGVIGQEAEQAMRRIVRDHDPAKDAPFAALAAVHLSTILQLRGDSEPDREKARLYQEAGEWLMTALKTDPSSDRVKRAIAKYNQQAKTLVAERAANAKAAEAMGTRLEDLKRRFAQARHLIERTEANAAQHLQRSKEILRSGRSANQGDMNLALTYKQRAWDAKKGSMVGADALIRDINAFLHEYRYELSKKVCDSLEEARNYLTWKKGEWETLEKEMK
jgi:tetratricopeptide (TPR) repeat protein